MILVDERIGSKHMAAMIPDSELSHLDAGDACWCASDGTMVGAEVKRLGDAISCMYDGRLADEQIPKMTAIYDVKYLIIEGSYRPEPGTGVLQQWREFDSSKETKCGRWTDCQQGRRRLMFSSFTSWLTSMECLGGLRLRHTLSSEMTASLLRSLHDWWQREGHSSFDVMHEFQGDGAALTRPQLLMRIAAQFPGIGWVKSAAVARHFKSLEAMVNAGANDWVKIDGIGRTIARRVREAITNDTE